MKVKLPNVTIGRSASASMPYYDDLWFVVHDAYREDRHYKTKAAVTRWLRARGLHYESDGRPTQSVAIYDRHPEEHGAAWIASIPAPLWMQFIARKKG